MIYQDKMGLIFIAKMLFLFYLRNNCCWLWFLLPTNSSYFALTVFVYEAEKDSVVWVNKEDYDKCNTGSPMATFRDGRTTFKLSHAGPYYFISGSDGNCAKNEKMVVVVMADRSGKSTPPEGLPNGQAESPPPPSPSSENGATTMSMKHSTLSFGFVLLGSISLLLAT